MAAVGVTAPAHNAVLLDSEGDPLAPVVLWCDRRCMDIAREQRRAWGEELLHRALVDLTHCWTLPQLTWVRQARPDLWSRTRRVLLGKDYLVYAITGAACTDATDAAGTAFYDPIRGEWLESVLTGAGIAPSLLPEVRPSTDIAGALSGAIAQQCGLTAGTPVVVGATDTAAELVSLGDLGPGDGLVKIATTGTVVVVHSEPAPGYGVLVYPHPDGRNWYTLAATNSAAAALDWFASVTSGGCASEDLPFEAAENLAPGAGGVVFIPNLDGSRTGEGAEFGAFIGLSAGHRQKHLLRAVLEGVAYSLADSWDRLRRLGPVPSAPFLTGGGLRNESWARIVLGTLDRDGRRVKYGEPASGAARLAAQGIGVSVEAPLSQLVSKPGPDAIAGLAEARRRYQRFERLLREPSSAVD